MPKLALISSLLAALVFSGCAVKMPVAGHTPRSTFGKATGPDGWESAFWGAVKDKDWAGVERHLSSNYVFTAAPGGFDKAQTLALLKRFDLTGFEITDFTSRPEGNDFVVTYTLAISGTFDGKPIAHPVTRILSVWQLQKKGEVLIAQSETAAPK
ncbi:MAG: nuclear transport factor 2 family protein [Acidobacteriaceae bacterium]